MLAARKVRGVRWLPLLHCRVPEPSVRPYMSRLRCRRRKGIDYRLYRHGLRRRRNLCSPAHALAKECPRLFAGVQASWRRKSTGRIRCLHSCSIPGNEGRSRQATVCSSPVRDYGRAIARREMFRFVAHAEQVPLVVK